MSVPTPEEVQEIREARNQIVRTPNLSREAWEMLQYTNRLFDLLDSLATRAEGIVDHANKWAAKLPGGRLSDGLEELDVLRDLAAYAPERTGGTDGNPE